MSDHAGQTQSAQPASKKVTSSKDSPFPAGNIHNGPEHIAVMTAFEHLQHFLESRYAIKYEDPYTHTQWRTTPPLPLTVDGQDVDVVAAIHDSIEHNLPISFFLEKVNGDPVGTLRISRYLFTNTYTPYIEAENVHGQHEIDFSNLTTPELLTFLDHVEQWRIEQPTKRTLRQKVTLALGLSTVGAIAIAAGVRFFTSDSRFDSQGRHLPGRSAPSEIDVTQNVYTLNETELAEVEGAPTLDVDQATMSTTGSIHSEPAEDLVGHVREVEVPQDGQCAILQVHGSPKTSFRVTRSANAPDLTVKVSHQNGTLVSESVPTAGLYPGTMHVEHRSDDGIAVVGTLQGSQNETFTLVTLCNRPGADSIDTPAGTRPDGHAFIEAIR